MSEYKDNLDKMIWSFSRLHLYEQCPYAFYLKYIEGREDEQNFYAENGSAMHSTFEGLLNHELTLEDAPGYYMEQFECIDSDGISDNTRENIFGKCLNYLCSVDSGFEEKYEILGVELKCSFKVGRKEFRGFIDLLMRNRKTNEIIVLDHKSADHFLKKNGEPLKNREDDFKAYKHQMYLYCKGVYEQYKQFPSKIMWHHFKDDGKLTVIDFNMSDYEETIQWAKDLVKQIYKDKDFAEMKSYMMCKQLCGFRNNCDYKDEE